MENVNDERVEIRDGVKEDETVILAPDTSLEDGSRVKT